MTRRTPETVAWLAQQLRDRATVLLARAVQAPALAAALALTATAYRALARAAQLSADLLQRSSRVTPMIDACTRAAAYRALARTYAHAAGKRGA